MNPGSPEKAVQLPTIYDLISPPEDADYLDDKPEFLECIPPSQILKNKSLPYLYQLFQEL